MSTRTAQFDLRGKVVAITGGARGIGLATANAFAQRGALVAIGDLDAAGVVPPPRGSAGTRSALRSM
jgi:NAD(P)-dependent dehydrogenase (short-subunit alcohol dehydrogenase family)